MSHNKITFHCDTVAWQTNKTELKRYSHILNEAGENGPKGGHCGLAWKPCPSQSALLKQTLRKVNSSTNLAELGPSAFHFLRQVHIQSKLNLQEVEDTLFTPHFAGVCIQIFTGHENSVP